MALVEPSTPYLHFMSSLLKAVMERDQSDDKAYRVSKKIEVLTQAQDS